VIPIIHRIYYKPKIIKGSIRCYVRRNKFNILPSTHCVCRDIRGSVHYEFVPIGQTVNQVYYLEVLKRLLEEVRRKRPELFANNSWILHHDNAWRPFHKTSSKIVLKGGLSLASVHSFPRGVLWRRPR